MDYCDTSDEIEKNPNIKRELTFIANGDASAFKFMWIMWNWSHVIDDLVDRDKEAGVENAAKYFIAIAFELTTNKFYQTNSGYLFGLIASMFNRWCDGEEFEKSDDKLKQAQSHVIKCGDLDLYLGVAYLTGGWDHARACKAFRTYDLNGFEFAHLRLSEGD
jgi:hypothetical protein